MKLIQETALACGRGWLPPLLLLAGISAPSWGWGTDWPQWRGPGRDGASRETVWDASSLTPAPRVVWSADVGPGHSAVSVSQGRACTLGSEVEIGEEEDTWHDVIYCFDARSGALLWKRQYLSVEVPFPGPRATPAMAGGLVYTLGAGGIVHCLSAEDGSIVWKRDLAQDGLTEVDHWGMCGSPVVAGDLLILTAASHGLALDRHTGVVRWKSAQGTAALATPYPFDWNGRQLVAIPGGDRLYALHVESGDIAFEVPWQQDFCLEPVLTGQGLLVPGTEGSVLLRPSVDGRETIERPLAGMTLSDHLSFVVLGDFVFGLDKGHLVCYDLVTGKLQWRRPVGEAGALSAAGDKIVFLRGDGMLTVFAASPEAYKEISSGRALELEDNRGKPAPEQNVCWTMPVLADGRIYARCNHGKLVSIDVSAEPAGTLSATSTPSPG